MNKLIKHKSAIAKSNKQFKSVKTTVLLRIAFKNFIGRKLRSFLTVLAVVIGVCAIFFLLSFGLGVQDLVTSQVIGNKSLKTIDITSPNSRIVKLDAEAAKSIADYPHVQRVGVQYSLPGIMEFSGGEVDVVTYGVNNQYQGLSDMDLVKGRLLEDADSRSVVLNLSALRSIGIDDASKAINKQVKILIPLQNVGANKDKISDTFSIVGVIESGSGSEMFIPSKVFDEVGVSSYNNVKAVIDEISNVEKVRTQIESNGFQTTSLTDTLEEINNIFKFFNIILVGFGSIGMVVAVLGMFNTLTIALLERTKEIGLMISLGARRLDMRKLFIFEAVIISFVGSVIGILVAMILGEIVNLYININAMKRGVTESFDLFSTPIWVIILIILATVLVGMAVVYIPARRAEKINPIDALRRE